MLTYNSAYNAKHVERDRSPRWAVIFYFDSAKTDGMALTSHDDFTTGLGTEFQGVLSVSPNGTSQSYDPVNASSSIGNLTISFADPGNLIADHIKANLDDGDGLRHKPVDVYGGYEGMAWVDFEQKAGMICGPIDMEHPGYRVQLSDVQREARKDILDPQTTTLTQSISDGTSEPGQTVLPITDSVITTFPVVERDASYIDGAAIITTACSVTVSGGTTTYALSSGSFPDSVAGASMRFEGFTTAGNNIEITIATWSATSITCTTTTQVTEAAGDSVTVWPQWSYVKLGEEIIKHGGGYTDGTYGNSLRIIQRGALGTTAVAHDVSPGTAADRRPKIEEYIVVESPAVKYLYATLTGVLHGQSGATLPDHWHLGISTDYISLTDFTGIGSDWWDTSDPTKGRQVRGVGLKKEDGKRFVEKEILLWLGARMPIYVNGEWGLRRLSFIPAFTGTVAELNVSNVISVDSMRYDTEAVINRVKAQWNWQRDLDDYNQTKIFVDAESIAAHKDAPPRSYKFRLVHTSAQTDRDLADHFEAIRSRYAAPPWIGRVTCSTRIDNVEIGDAITLNIPGLYDLASGSNLNRVYEVLSIAPSYGDGTVSYTLIGSTASPTPIDHFADVTRLDDAAYGANIFGTGAAVDLTTVASIDGSGNLLADVSLSGDYYYDVGDLSISGRTITLTGATRLAVKGEFIRGTGSVDGVGAGNAGAAAGTSEADAYGTLATAGYFGTTQPGGGANVASSPSLFPAQPSTQAIPTVGDVNVAVPLAIVNNGTSLSGVPADMSGSGGGGGASVYSQIFNGAFTHKATGGTGGSGGASFTLVCRGFQASSGSGGSIDLSGDDGTIGGVSTSNYAGSGAGGAPGVFSLILDGAFTPPALGSWLVLNYGDTPIPPDTSAYAGFQNGVAVNPPPYYSIFHGVTGSAQTAAFRVQFVPDNLAAEERTADPVHQIATPSAPTLAAYTIEPTTAGDAGAGLGWVKVSWTATTDPNARGYQFEAKRNSEAASEYQTVRVIEDATATNFKFQVTEGVQYNVRMRVLSDQGAEGHSDYSTAGNVTVSASSPNIRDHVALAIDTAGTATSGSVTVGGGAVTGATVETTSGTSAKAIRLNASADELEFYGDRGDGTVEKLATIGINTAGSDSVIGLFGTTNSGNSKVAVYARSNSSVAVSAASNGSTALSAQTTGTGADAVDAFSDSGVAVNAQYSSGGEGPLRIHPSATTSAPSNSAGVGTCQVTSDGKLYINTNGSTTWALVGGQT